MALKELMRKAALSRFGHKLCHILAAVGIAAFAITSTAQAQISTIRDAEIETLLREYTDPILVAAGLDPNSVNIYIVNDPTLNAFVAGGQNIFFHTGLIVAADTPNELIGVAAHETGHMSGGHLARMSDGLGAAKMPLYLGLGLGLIALAAGSPEAGMALIAGGQHIATMEMLAYTRVQESAADQAAVGFLTKTGQSANGLIGFFNKFRYQETMSEARRYPYWRTHPLSADRIAALRQRVGETPYADVKDSKESAYRFRMAKAKLYGFLDNPDVALRRFPQSNKSRPAKYARSVAYFRSGHIDKAIGELDDLIEAEPNNPYFHELKGQILFESGRIAESIPEHELAIKLAPTQALLRVNLAQAYIAQPGAEQNVETNQAAQEQLKIALNMDDQIPFAYHQLAITHARQGDPGLADLATAERFYRTGQMTEAATFASRAKDKLKKNTPQWNRAIDILNVAMIQREQQGRRRQLSFTTSLSEER